MRLELFSMPGNVGMSLCRRSAPGHRSRGLNFDSHDMKHQAPPVQAKRGPACHFPGGGVSDDHAAHRALNASKLLAHTVSTPASNDDARLTSPSTLL